MAERGGQIGNQNAKKARQWREALARALARHSGESVDKGLDLVAGKVVQAAAKGERWAAEEIGNRFDGKPHQSISHDGDGEGGAIQTEILIRAVDPPGDERT